jgi:glutamyl-tRNA synthetase
MNGVYLRKLSVRQFVQQAMPFLDRDLPESARRPLDESYVSQVLSLIQERAKTLAEVPQLASFFFLDELQYDPGLLLGKKLDAQAAAKAITIVSQKLQEVTTWDATTLEGIVRPLATELNLGTGEFFGLLRVAVTGRTAAPPLFQTMAVLGKMRCLKRFNSALRLLPT